MGDCSDESPHAKGGEKGGMLQHDAGTLRDYDRLPNETALPKIEGASPPKNIRRLLAGKENETDAPVITWCQRLDRKSVV